MSSVEEMQDRIELFLNQLQAEIQVYQTTLQYLIVNTIRTRPNPSDLIADMKTSVLWALDNPVGGSPDPQGDLRMKELTKMRAQAFFQSFERALAAPRAAVDPWKMN